MAKIFIFIATILLVQLVAANKSAPAEDDNIFLNIFNAVEGKISEAHDRILNAMGVSDNNEAAEKIKTDSKAYATKLGGLIDEIKEKAKSSTGELSESATQLTNKLTEIVEKLHTDTPQLKELREKIDSSYTHVVAATKEFTTQAGPMNEEVQQLLHNVLSSTQRAAEDFIEGVKKNA